VHNEKGEPETLVISRVDAEALGIHLEPRNSVPLDVVEHMLEETVTEVVQEPQLKEQDIPPPIVGKETETVPEVTLEIQEPAKEEDPETVMALGKLSKVDKQQVEPELVPELAGPSTCNSILNKVIFYYFSNLTLFIFHQF